MSRYRGAIFMRGLSRQQRSRWFSGLAVFIVVALMPAIAAPSVAHADTPPPAPPTFVPVNGVVDLTNGSPSLTTSGVVQSGSILTMPNGESALTYGDCQISMTSGCLVYPQVQPTDNPVRVGDGFWLSPPPGPAEWRHLEQKSENIVANLRGVPADTQNRYWARPETNAMTLIQLFDLIQTRGRRVWMPLDDSLALKKLSDEYQSYENEVAQLALTYYNNWKANPCGFRVPVGLNPWAYRDGLGVACKSKVFPTLTNYPVPEADQFTSWAREVVEQRRFRASVPQIHRFMPGLTDAQAQAEVSREYQELVGSLQKGFAFLAAQGYVVQNAQPGQQAEAGNEILDTLQQVLEGIGQDNFQDMAQSILETLVSPLLPYFIKEELGMVAKAGASFSSAATAQAAQQILRSLGTVAQQALTIDAVVDFMADAGMFIGTVIVAAAAVITTRSIMLTNDTAVLPELNARAAAANAKPDLPALLDDVDGREKIVNIFATQMLPDFTTRKHQEPGDVGKPGDSPASSLFRVYPAGYSPSIGTDEQFIVAEDWSRPDQAQRWSAGNGWVSRAPRVASKPNGDVFGDTWWDTAINYTDAEGGRWQAWPTRGQLMHIRRAAPVRGTLAVYGQMENGLASAVIDGVSVPCKKESWALGTSQSIESEFSGYKCVLGSSNARFTQDLHVGDHIQVGDEVKEVEHIFSDRVFTTTTPFQSQGKVQVPQLWNGREAVRLTENSDDCWNTGDCKLSDHFEFRAPAGNFESVGYTMMAADWGNHPPVSVPSVAGTLHSVAGLQLPPECDAAGNCKQPVVNDWTFSPDEDVTIESHAYDPDPGDTIPTQTAKACTDENGTQRCDDLTETGAGRWTYKFPHAGAWTITVTATDEHGKSSSVDTPVNLRKVGQTITDLGATTTEAVAGTGATLAPVASSELPVDVTSTSPAICTAGGSHGTTISFTKAGTCTLTFNQPGDFTFTAAPARSSSITVKKAAAGVYVTPGGATAGQTVSQQFRIVVEPGAVIPAAATFKMTVPKGWTAPQLTNPSGPGYVAIEPGSVTNCAGVALATVTGSGPWTIQGAAAGCNAAVNGVEWIVNYSNASTTSTAGKDSKAVEGDPYVFPMTLQVTGGTLQLNNDPALGATLDHSGGWGRVWVTGAPATALGLTVAKSVAAGPKVPVTVFFVDQYGNKTGDPFAWNETSVFVDVGFAGDPTALRTLRERPGAPTDVTIPLTKAGPVTLRASVRDASGGSRGIAAAQATTSVVASTPADIEISVNPKENWAGGTQVATVQTVDAYGNKASPGYRGTVHFTSDDPQATLPADYTFTAADAGKHDFTVRFGKTGHPTITVTDITSTPMGMTDTTSSVAFPGPPATVQITGVAANSPAGVAKPITVAAFDQYGNPANTNWYSVSFTSSDTKATFPRELPQNYLRNEDSHTFQGLTFRTAGSQTVTATVGIGATARSATFTTNVQASGDAVSFRVSSADTTAGANTPVTVTALDGFNNTATGFVGTVRFTSSDGKAVLPGNYTFLANENGVHEFKTPKFKTAGPQSVTVTSTTNAAVTGTGSLVVDPAEVKKIELSAPPAPAGTAFSVTAGTEQSFRITARDAYGNIATGYRGTVHLTSTDSHAALPADYTFVAGDAGQYTFPVTFKTRDARTLTATDTAALPVMSSTLKGIVAPGLPTTFVVNNGAASNDAIVGTAVTATTELKDALGNVVTAADFRIPPTTFYTWTATYPTQTGFQNKGAAPKITFGRPGTQNVAVKVLFPGANNVVQQLTANSTYVVRDPQFATLAVTGPATGTAGVAHNVVVTVKNASGAVAGNYRGTVHFTSEDPNATLPPNYTFTAADAGTHTFTITPRKSGTVITAVTDTGNAALVAELSQGVRPGVPVALVVNDGAPTIDVLRATQTPLEVRFRDQYGNVFNSPFELAPGDTQHPQFAYDVPDGAHYTPFGPDPSQGRISFGDIGPATVDIDASFQNPSHVGVHLTTTAHFMVNEPQAFDVQLTGPATGRTGAPVGVTVTARNSDQSVDTLYAGTVVFDANDSGATLPAMYTFTPADRGTKTFNVTFATPGNRTVRIDATRGPDDTDQPLREEIDIAVVPGNDDFGNAAALSGGSGSVTGTNSAATTESGEPAAWSGPNKTVWYRWTAPASGVVTFDTCTSTNFDTMLAAYAGSAVNSLQKLAESDEDCGSQSRITFGATAGQSYPIQIDGWNGQTGSFTLAWSTATPPANDAFANAATISGESGNTTGNVFGASGQAGEPHVGSSGPNNTVWYSWQAPESGLATFETCSSGDMYLNTTIGVYTGAAVNALATSTTGDQGCDDSDLTKVSFAADRNTTYRVAVDTGSVQTGSSPFELSWSLRTNDSYVFPVELAGASGSIGGTTVGMTSEDFEPVTCAIECPSPNGPNATAWYYWVAPATGDVTIDTCAGSAPFDSLLAVYTGPSGNDFDTRVTESDDAAGCGIGKSRVSFRAVVGRGYSIQVDGVNGQTGHFTLSWSLAPENDDFADAIVVSGASGTVSGGNDGATTQTNEPAPCQGSAACSGHWDGPYHTVWYNWTAPADGTVTFDTCQGPSVDTLLAAYTGSTLTALNHLAESDDGCGFRSKITFEVTANTVYRIQVDGAVNQVGRFNLRWALNAANDAFARAIALSGASGSVDGSNVYAGNEPGEPATCVDCQGMWDGPRKTMWYSWTAPANGTATIDTCSNEAFDTMLAVYTGSALDSLTRIANDDYDCGYLTSRVTFAATAGTTYRIQVDGWIGRNGPFTLSWNLT